MSAVETPAPRSREHARGSLRIFASEMLQVLAICKSRDTYSQTRQRRGWALVVRDARRPGAAPRPPSAPARPATSLGRRRRTMLVHRLSQLSRADLSTAGGKGANLG